MSSPTPPIPAQTVPPELFHLSLNNDCKETLVFLHGIFCSHLEYALLTPYLSNYHLLLIDMPQHSRSKHMDTPFTPSDSASHIAKLITRHAHGGKAHIIGLSAGGFVAMQLAITHPDLVSSLYVSGATPLTSWKLWFAQHPRVLWLFLRCTIMGIPLFLYNFLLRRMEMVPHDELRGEMQGNFCLDLLKVGYASISEMRLEGTMAGLRDCGVKRVCFVAGELQDDVPTTRDMARILRSGMGEGSVCKAFVAKGAVHGWDLQFPKLFAESVRAWVEDGKMPEGMEEVD